MILLIRAAQTNTTQPKSKESKIVKFYNNPWLISINQSICLQSVKQTKKLQELSQIMTEEQNGSKENWKSTTIGRDPNN